MFKVALPNDLMIVGEVSLASPSRLNSHLPIDVMAILLDYFSLGKKVSE
jgi:hypothetical protein